MTSISLNHRVKRSAEAFEKLQAYASTNGFELLDTEWKGNTEKHFFRHIQSNRLYDNSPAKLSSSGFPKDFRSNADRLHDLAMHAQQHNFKLLEALWLGALKKHRFKHIPSGKIHESTPDNATRYGFPKDLRDGLDRIKELSRFATENGYALLEKNWRGNAVKYKFKKLDTGADYEWAYTRIMGKHGFPKDLRTTTDKLRELQRLSQQNGFSLVSHIWQGVTKKYQFKHIASGKMYSAAPQQVMQSGFSKDLRSASDLIQALAEQATKYGFKLLDDTWRNSKSTYNFEHLDSGIAYQFVANNVMGPRGFPKDLRSDLDKFNSLFSYAQKNGFNLLEKKWLGVNDKHKFQHIISGVICEWSPAQVLGNNKSFPKNLSATRQAFAHAERFNKIKSLAAENGFELMDTTWKGSETDHSFKHIATNTIYQWPPSRIMASNGFPLVEGQRYMGEEICRQFMKHIFGGQFKTENQRLKTIHGKHLQLDGFESFSAAPPILYELGLNITEVAFEFQGHRSHYQDLNVIQRDKLRVQYCKALNILLVVIEKPEPWAKIRDADYMTAHISMAINKALNIQKIPNYKPGFKIDLAKWNPDLELYNALQRMSEKNGFLLLEDKWLGSSTKHRFRHIQSGSLYSSIPATLMRERNRFPKNFRTPAEDLNDISIHANKSGFKLLEDKWLGCAKKHYFQHVASGNLYQFLPHNIKRRGFPKDSALGSRYKPVEILDTFSALSEKPHTAEVEVAANIGHLFFDVIPPAETFILPSGHAENLNSDSTFGIKT